MAAEKTRAVAYPDDLHEKAKAISARRGRSISAIVADASRKEIERQFRKVVAEQAAELAAAGEG